MVHSYMMCSHYLRQVVVHRYTIGALVLLILLATLMTRSSGGIERLYTRRYFMNSGRGSRQQPESHLHVGWEDGVNVVEKVVSPEEASRMKCKPDSNKQIILLTYGRSGSTLTADIIQRRDSVFYYFEPLHNLAQAFSDTQNAYMKEEMKYLHLTDIEDYNQRAVHILEKLMTCDYEDLPKVAANNLHMRSSPSTKRLAECLKRQPSTGGKRKCLEEAEDRCKEKSIHFLKVIRLGTKSVGLLMDKYPCLKMVYLVRDPRGSYQSKKKAFNIISTNTTYEAERYCVRMAKDIDSTIQLMQLYPDRIMTTRYEHIAEEPIKSSAELYSFLDLRFTETIANYIRANTLSGKGDQDTYSVKRTNSTEASYAWRKDITFSEAKSFDRMCADVYGKLGYLPVHSEAELRNVDISLKVEKKGIS